MKDYQRRKKWRTAQTVLMSENGRKRFSFNSFSNGESTNGTSSGNHQQKRYDWVEQRSQSTLTYFLWILFFALFFRLRQMEEKPNQSWNEARKNTLNLMHAFFACVVISGVWASVHSPNKPWLSAIQSILGVFCICRYVWWPSSLNLIAFAIYRQCWRYFLCATSHKSLCCNRCSLTVPESLCVRKMGWCGNNDYSAAIHAIREWMSMKKIPS